MAQFDIILATCDGILGIGNAIPWDFKEDMKWFRSFTMGKTVLMGPNTFASCGPLSGRNKVLIGKLEERTDITSRKENKIRDDIDAILHKERGSLSKECNSVVAGGELVYRVAMEHPALRYIYHTEVPRELLKDLDGNIITFNIDDYSGGIEQVENEEVPEFVTVYRAKNMVDYEYNKLVEHVLSSGLRKENRTGIATLSCFGYMSRYSLHSNQIPLISTKPIFWKGVVEELRWFLNGDTNVANLRAKGVNIWNANAFPDDTIGPGYGHQWRNYNGSYHPLIDDGQVMNQVKGIDQIKQCVDLLRNDPNSRRIILSAWNPEQLPAMALPPCHVMSIFTVTEGNLSCMLIQRSADIGLGVPFNIASYGLLTHIMARLAGLRAFEFIHNMADAHIYENHVEQLREQIIRPTHRPATISFSDYELNGGSSSEEITADINTIIDSIQLHYERDKRPVKMEMAV